MENSWAENYGKHALKTRRTTGGYCIKGFWQTSTSISCEQSYVIISQHLLLSRILIQDLTLRWSLRLNLKNKLVLSRLWTKPLLCTFHLCVERKVSLATYMPTNEFAYIFIQKLLMESIENCILLQRIGLFVLHSTICDAKMRFNIYSEWKTFHWNQGFTWYGFDLIKLNRSIFNCILTVFISFLMLQSWIKHHNCNEPNSYSQKHCFYSFHLKINTWKMKSLSLHMLNISENPVTYYDTFLFMWNLLFYNRIILIYEGILVITCLL